MRPWLARAPSDRRWRACRPLRGRTSGRWRRLRSWAARLAPGRVPRPARAQGPFRLQSQLQLARGGRHLPALRLGVREHDRAHARRAPAPRGRQVNVARARMEQFGGIVELERPRALLQVDREMMRELGYPDSP